jgi:hypothetical protein
MQPAPMPIWVKADMAASHLDVRFTPPKADIRPQILDVRFVPIADIHLKPP